MEPTDPRRKGSGVTNLKDPVEPKPHTAVCAHEVTLAAEQQAIVTDWTTALSTLGLGWDSLALCKGRIRRVEPIPERSELPPRVRRRIHEGLRFVVGDTSLRAVCPASAAFQFSFAAMMTVSPLFLPRELHLFGTAVGLALAATGRARAPGLRAGRPPACRTGSGTARYSWPRRPSATACSRAYPRYAAPPR